MKKLITNAYWKLDQFLVDRANEAVKAWNWTTGRTRADLANGLNFGGSVLISPVNLVVGSVYTLNAFSNYSLNKRADKLESNSREVVDHRVESRKGYCKFFGPLYLGLGASVGFLPSGESRNNAIEGAGIALFGLSAYVMRADYQKPRKDCVRRGIEKLVEAIKHKELAPEMARYERQR